MTFTFEIPPPDEPIPNVFHLRTPAHILRKLYWEISNLRKHLTEAHGLWTPLHIAYSGFNTAVTAWHCVDWAWRAADSELHKEIARTFKFNLKSRDRDNVTLFGQAMIEASDAIRICAEIANGSKHMGRENPNFDIGAELIWTFDAKELEKPHTECFLQIRFETRLHRAEDIFDRAFEFWERRFGEWGYIEGRYVGPVDNS